MVYRLWFMEDSVGLFALQSWNEDRERDRERTRQV